VGLRADIGSSRVADELARDRDFQLIVTRRERSAFRVTRVTRSVPVATVPRSGRCVLDEGWPRDVPDATRYLLSTVRFGKAAGWTRC
jgi:hypothetical protein